MTYSSVLSFLVISIAVWKVCCAPSQTLTFQRNALFKATSPEDLHFAQKDHTGPVIAITRLHLQEIDITIWRALTRGSEEGLLTRLIQSWFMLRSLGFQTFDWFSVLPPFAVSVTHLQRLAFAVRLPLVKSYRTVPPQVYVPPIKTSSTIQASVRNLDRIRVFRRRQDSPNLSADEREPRERSPGWFQRIHRNMSSSKRSRSSSTQPETPTEVDRAETLPQPIAARDHKSDGLPRLPAFLQQSPSGRCLRDSIF
jgi:hypothetical protein